MAFNTLKTTITSVLILVFSDTTVFFFYIEADSSDYIIEAVLSQESNIDNVRVEDHELGLFYFIFLFWT